MRKKATKDDKTRSLVLLDRVTHLASKIEDARLLAMTADEQTYRGYLSSTFHAQFFYHFGKTFFEHTINSMSASHVSKVSVARSHFDSEYFSIERLNTTVK